MSAAVSFLIVEDDDLVGRVLQRALHHHGRTSLVATLEEARYALATDTFSAVVVDVGLPDGSGLDLVQFARHVDPTIPALVLSGSVDASRLAEAHLLGAHYLLKPVNGMQLDLFAERTRARLREREARISTVVSRWSFEYALTSAEAAILILAVHGAPRGQLADLRDVARSTVKKQVQAILEKTGDTSLEAAVSRVLRCALDES